MDFLWSNWTSTRVSNRPVKGTAMWETRLSKESTRQKRTGGKKEEGRRSSQSRQTARATIFNQAGCVRSTVHFWRLADCIHFWVQGSTPVRTCAGSRGFLASATTLVGGDTQTQQHADCHQARPPPTRICEPGCIADYAIISRDDQAAEDAQRLIKG